jgi:DNA repair exonuclease SbcCD nuclease subunit
VAQRFERWGRPVCIAPGNHDPLQSRSLYALVEWPENVTIFGAEWSDVHLPDLDVTVHGRGFTAPEEDAPLVDGLSVQGSGRHVIVAHGSDVSARPDRHHPYRPFTPEQLDAFPVDYIALGHYHRYAHVGTQRVRAVYCGSPIPLGFNETGDHGVVLARLGTGETAVELLPLPARRFVTLEVDLSGCTTQPDVLAQARAVLETHAHDFVRLFLRGSLPPDLELDTPGLTQALERDVHALELRDQTAPEYDLDAIARESTVRGLFVRALQARLAGAGERERDVVQRAIYFGLDAFAGRPQSR